MTLKITFNNGDETKTQIRRDIKPHQLAEWREGFYRQASSYKWGVMSQLKGKQEIQLARF